MSPLSVVPFAPGRADQAFALVRLVSSVTDVGRWRAFVALRLGGGGGMLMAVAGDEMIHGIAAWRLDDDLRHGRVLRVDLFAAVELNGRAPVRRALFDALEQEAAAAGCDAICLTLPNRGHADADVARIKGWASIGLELDTVDLVKRLAPTAARKAAPAHAASGSGA